MRLSIRQQATSLGKGHKAAEGSHAAQPFATHAVAGPYASSVRDGLNDMVLGTRLAQHGVRVSGDAALTLDSVRQAVPSQLPTDGYISSPFGSRTSPFAGGPVEHHRGVDFAVDYGSSVYATAGGVVTYAGWYRGLGKMVAVDHGFGIVTRYGHNSQLKVRVGEHVQRGQQIAAAGSTGHSTGVHVHYEVWVNQHAIDPSKFMFEAPEHSASLAALPPASFARLGLAMGGDNSDALAYGRAHAAMPTPAERLPVNLFITGAFLFAALVLIASLLPRRPD